MRRRPAALPGAIAFALLAAPLHAAEGDARRAELSARLFAAAEETRDPILALAAARLREGVLGQRIEREPERDAPSPPASAAPAARSSDAPAAPEATAEDRAEAAEAGPEPEGPLTAEDMFAAATEFAAGDPAILGLIEDAQVSTMRGVVSGQVYSISRIRGGGTDTYRPLEYQGNSYAEVYVEGQGATDLNIMVYDSAGRLVCSDTDISAIAYCGWRPPANEAYSVEVLNRGEAASSYTLITN